MKLSVAVSIVTIFSLTLTANLLGIEYDTTGPFDLLKYTFKLRVEEEKCHYYLDINGEVCNCCTISSNGQEAGICVSADLADRIQQINPEVICE